MSGISFSDLLPLKGSFFKPEKVQGGTANLKALVSSLFVIPDLIWNPENNNELARAFLVP